MPDGQLLSPREAMARLSVSRTLFERKYRPQLTAHRLGPRTVRFDSVELDALIAETASAEQQQSEAAMFRRRTVKDALEHAWRMKWRKAKGAAKKAALKRKVEQEIGEVRLSQLDYNRVEQWIEEMQTRELALATIKSRLSCLIFALRMVAPKGWIKVVPELPELGTAKAKLRWLRDDPDEEALLLAACSNTFTRHVLAETMQHVIFVLVDTGARVGELVKVRPDSIGRHGVWFLDRKAGDDLSVPLTARAKRSLEWLLAHPYWRARVRGARDDAKRATSAQNWVTHRFTEVRDKAGLPDVTCHTLRHTFCSRLVQAGVSIYVVRQLAGHSSVRTTERYAHLAPAAPSVQAALSALERRGKDETNVTPFRRPE